MGDREPAAGSEVPCPQSPLAASHTYGEGTSEEKKPRIQAFCRRVVGRGSTVSADAVGGEQLVDYMGNGMWRAFGSFRFDSYDAAYKHASMPQPDGSVAAIRTWDEVLHALSEHCRLKLLETCMALG